jgi:hypothetical protein
MSLFYSGRRIAGHVKYMPAKQCTATIEALCTALRPMPKENSGASGADDSRARIRRWSPGSDLDVTMVC